MAYIPYTDRRRMQHFSISATVRSAKKWERRDDWC